MGRLRDAIEAGRQAVATAALQDSRTRALLVLGLDDAPLRAAVRARLAADAAPGRRTLLIADRLPDELVTADRLVFEHLPLLSDLMLAAPQAQAEDHRLRRLLLILRRWQVADCFWVPGEAEDLIRVAREWPVADRAGIAFPQQPDPGGEKPARR